MVMGVVSWVGDPLLTTFGDFPIFDPSPRISGLQGQSRTLERNSFFRKVPAVLGVYRMAQGFFFLCEGVFSPVFSR